MIFEVITLLSAGAIFVILLRRLPLAYGSRPRETAASTASEAKLVSAHEGQSVEDQLGLAEQAFSRKEYDTAEDLYLKVAAARPDLAKVYNRLGIIYLERKNYKDARDAFLTVLKFDDQLASRHFNLAMAYMGLGNTRKAEAAVKQALSLDPGNERYQKMLEKVGGTAPTG